MSEPSLYSVKMRASREGSHISGAEKLSPLGAIAKTSERLIERALSHAKGLPDFINLKVEAMANLVRLPSLAVTTHETSSAAEGRAAAVDLLRSAGITRIDEIFARFAEAYGMRGAMLLDADTLERLEPDPVRGVRATYMDDADSLVKGTASGKNHYAEAIVLATKVQHAPHIVGEICISDDPNYVTGYVATRALGYRRITTLKRKGDPNGGRIFLYRGPHDQVPETIRFLEETPVLVTDVPVLSPVEPEHRWDSLEDDLQVIHASHLDRHCQELPQGAVVLSSNDYLGLANHPAVKAAAAKALADFGTGSTGARLTTGTLAPHVELERKLAGLKGTEAALTWATGYMANVGTISALVKKGDVILSDALNHASIIDGCRLSGADIVVYRHNDMEDLAHKLAGCREYRRRLVVSDGVFSMDGDLLDLPRFVQICRENDAFSMVDEAHAMGVIGRTGRGLVEHFGCEAPDIQLGTLSKAFGSEGGFVCGRRTLIDYLVNKSRSFIFSTAPGAPAVAAASAAIDVMLAEPERVERLRENVRLFVSDLAQKGISVKTASAIVPIVIGDEARALALSQKLKEAGFLIPAIRYPTVARGQARLRVALSAAHSPADLLHAVDMLSSLLCSEVPPVLRV